jgi:hypothetical protein
VTTKTISENRTNEHQAGMNTAILAEILFLANLLLIPLIPFLILFYLYRKYSQGSESLAFNHIRQTFFASIMAGIFIICVAGIFYFATNISAAITWTIILTYMTCVHSLFVMYGIYGLSKAMAGQWVKFPLIHRIKFTE